MLRFKTGAAGARIAGMQPELATGLMVATGVYAEADLNCLVTAVTDSAHMGGSLHYVGFAADLARPPEEKASGIRARLKETLGDEWDVVIEGDHLHIEFQPKKGLNLG